MIRVIPVGSQPIFLVVVLMSRHSLVCVHLFDVFRRSCSLWLRRSRRRTPCNFVQDMFLSTRAVSVRRLT